MDKVINYIDRSIGLIKVFNDTNLSLIKKESVSLAGTIINPGEKTTLNGLFNAEVNYLGTHDGLMQFQIGEESDLFENKIWTSEFKRIGEERIMNIYQLGTARDYFYKNEIWK